MPEICSCEEGYIGKHCTQRCDHDRWGLDCKNLCQCQNGAACDNKSGICHCIAGWTGQFCEQTCPPGTHGIMCRKACDCDEKPCHHQTGACIMQDHPLELNVSHVIVETVNSTLEKMGILPRPATATATATPSALPEVILIKQSPSQNPGQHTPKIILHQSSSDLLENLHTAAAAGVPAPEVIHVITNGVTSPQEHLAGFIAGDGNSSQSATDQQSGLVTTLIVIMLLLLVAIAVGSLYVYQRYHHKEAIVYNANGTVTTQPSNPEVVLTEAFALGKNFHEPLPQPPVVSAKTAHTNDAPAELYDTPSNNSSIKTPPYAYARKESLYSIVTPKSRKGSLDSHLYDEIRYHQQQHHQHHLHHQHPQTRAHPQHFQHATTAAAYLPAQTPAMDTHHHHSHHRPHHISHLIIPPQNSNFLQVPAPITAKRIAHL
ncbi:GL21251 [Drosophila persimilis]|uniref:GL21251 n=2 Tax=Drosophila persimilis TaxID=7234 RepID=B4GX39_DROPE|nr:GL21251 [Drosophila persimilis]